MQKIIFILVGKLMLEKIDNAGEAVPAALQEWLMNVIIAGR